MKKTFTYRLNIFLFLLPALILFVGILIAPIIMSAIYSVHDFNSISDTSMKFVGLENYITLFTKDAIFTESLKNNIIVAVVTVPTSIGLAILMAIFANKVKTGKGTRTAKFTLK